MFTIYDVDYYPAVSIGEIPQIVNQGYCYLLYDFGVLTLYAQLSIRVLVIIKNLELTTNS